MGLIRKYISFLTALLISLEFPFAKSTPQEISIDIVQTHRLYINSSLIFQIPAFASSYVGTFDIAATPAEDQLPALIALRRKSCEGEPLPFEGVPKTPDFFGLSFTANTSQSNCFSISLASEVQEPFLDLTVQVTFSPIGTILTIGKPLVIDLAENIENKFAFKFENFNTQVILIALKNVHETTIDSASISKLYLKPYEGNCLDSISDSSWMCYLSSGNEFQKFSFYGSNNTESYEILISEITPHNVDADAEVRADYSIIGFGTLLKVDIPTVGVLKVRAWTFDAQYLPVIGAFSLGNLFEILAQETGSFQSSNDGSIQELTIRNSQLSTSFYCFVPEQKNKRQQFSISIDFIRHAILEVGERAIFYIDPGFYEYQHIDLKLNTGNLPEKYEVTIRAEGSEAFMSLYFDIKSYDNQYSVFPDENNCKIRVASVASKAKELSLSFVGGLLDKSAYLSLHAVEKGFFMVEAKKIEPVSLWKTFILILCANCLIIYIFVCLAKLYKTNELEDMPEWPQVQGSVEIPNTETEIAVQVPGMEESEIDSTRKLVSGFRTKMLKKLKRQYKTERSMKIEQQNHKELHKNEENEHQVIDINEEEACDICYENKKTTVFEPCNHKCACTLCALKIVHMSAKCPLCREKIVQIQLNTEVKSEFVKNEKQDPL